MSFDKDVTLSENPVICAMCGAASYAARRATTVPPTRRSLIFSGGAAAMSSRLRLIMLTSSLN